MAARTQNNEMIVRHPPNSRMEADEQGYIVRVPGSDGVALDEGLAQLWQAADGKTVDNLAAMSEFATSSLQTNLLALRAAGLLLPMLESKPKNNPQSSIPNPSLVSVVIVSRNGRHHLQECLPSLTAQTYPRLEIIIVDDASNDNTDTFLQEQFPEVRHIFQTNGPNFAAGCNLGIAHANGELIFLLNNDTVLEPDCVQELVAAYAGGNNVGGVAAMMRFYHNRPFVNGLGTSTRRLGFGHDMGIGSLDVGQFGHMTQTPLLCFGAALIPRAVFEQVGPIEESFQFYFEDADWSYRARALGFNLIPAPRAIVYHKFSASTSLLPSAFKIRLATRNRRWLVFKNYPLLARLVQSGLYTVDDTARLLLHLWRREGTLAAAIIHARWEYWRGLPRMAQAQRGKRRQAVNLAQLAQPFPLPQMAGSLPRLSEELVDTYYQPFLLQKTDAPRQRLLIISPDSVNVSMGGVGIRYWELAHQLAGSADVTLAIPNETDLTVDTFAIRQYEEERSATLKSLAETADIILLSGFTIYHHPFLRDTNAYFIFDLYDPMVLENLERFADRPSAERDRLHQVGVNTFNELFSLGDFFICASEKQRDYWLGALTAANRVNPAVYTADPTLRRLIDTVPFGLPDTPPQPTQKVLKGVWPGIGSDDKVILWGGGLWDWLDPLTVIEAMPAILDQVPQACLFFLGTKHPNPNVPPSRMAAQAIERAAALGLKDKAVFFNEWTPYRERVNFLLEADVGVSLHGDHIETRFAVRTRLMDYLWANLPMVVGGGDVLSDLVETHDLGYIVAAGDVDGVTQSIVALLQTPVDPARFQPVTALFHWSRVAKPLQQYVQNPWKNGERGGGRKGTAVSPQLTATPLQRLPAKVVTSLRERGLNGLWRDMHSYLAWIRQQ